MCGIAIYSLRVYEQTFNERLHSIEPFWKFWGVKGLLSVNFFQKTALAIFGHVLTQTSLSDEAFRTFVNYYLLTVEAGLLAGLNVRSDRPPSGQA